MDPKSDSNLVERLTYLVEYIVNSGEKQTDVTKMKEIKKICRISDLYVAEVFKILMHQLNQKHSEVRLAALHITKEIFQRSHHFRDLLAADFQNFSKLVLDIDPKAPLPPPPAALKQLKITAMKTIKEWNEVYGEAYKKLKIGYLYLKKSKAVDFEDLEARSVQERLRIEARETKLNLIKQEKLKALKEEIGTEEGEMLDCVTQICNGFGLLIPDEFEMKEVTQSADFPSDVSNPKNDLRAHGLTNSQFSLVIEVKPFQIQVTQDNKEIIQCIHDQYRLLTNRFLPMAFKWNITATKLGAEEQLQKQVLDLKLKVELAAKKYQELNLSAYLESSSDPESDLETVPDINMDSFEDDTFIDYAGNRSGTDDQPGSSQVSNKVCRKHRKISQAKLLPLDIDSYASSQSVLPLPTFSMNVVESYWVQDPESGPAGTSALVTHPVELSEAFCPVKWTCRAPLPSGKLCPRSDRHKCPFHGPIVARDEQGQPKDPSSIRPPRKSAIPDWQEPTLLADIKAATGIDLTMPTKGKRLKKQFSNLTDIKALNNTARSRLEKKVLKRSTVKKVASVMDTIDAKRAQVKFGDQWNYNG